VIALLANAPVIAILGRGSLHLTVGTTDDELFERIMVSLPVALVARQLLQERPSGVAIVRLGRSHHDPDPVLIATEGALWGSIKAHGFLTSTVIVSDDAGQFNVGQHALCWVHDLESNFIRSKSAIALSLAKRTHFRLRIKPRDRGCGPEGDGSMGGRAIQMRKKTFPRNSTTPQLNTIGLGLGRIELANGYQRAFIQSHRRTLQRKYNRKLDKLQIKFDSR
jgi:hypothetical protein